MQFQLEVRQLKLNSRKSTNKCAQRRQNMSWLLSNEDVWAVQCDNVKNSIFIKICSCSNISCGFSRADRNMHFSIILVLTIQTCWLKLSADNRWHCAKCTKKKIKDNYNMISYCAAFWQPHWLVPGVCQCCLFRRIALI